MDDASKQQSDKMLKSGLVASLVAAVCCFTPLLVIAFTGVGLAGLIGGLDYFLFPMLFASLGVVSLALYIRAGRPGVSPKPLIAILVIAFSAALIWLEFRYAIRISLAAAALVTAYWLYLRSANTQTAS